jgi:hypothetical protein
MAERETDGGEDLSGAKEEEKHLYVIFVAFVG